MESLDTYPGPGPSSASAASLSSTQSAPPQSIEICKFFKLGTCRYGAACRFLHMNNESEELSPVAEATPDASSSNSASVSVGSSFSFKIDPLKWINAPEFIPKAKQTPVFVPQKSVDEMMDEDMMADENVEHEVDLLEGACENTRDMEDAEGSAETSGSSSGSGSGVMSYAAIVTMHNNHNGMGIIEDQADSVLCPYYENSGVCLLEGCPYEHGELCELCGKFCLNPADKEQQRQHNVECIKQHELDMEHSFAVQRSKDKICGICLEVILEKPGREQRFGILPNCGHVFCLECIRTWRKAKNFENKIKRGCPSCRISSDFVCPSIVWVEGRDEKDKLINDYKKACNTTHCKHFKQGTGKCPFGNKCFYKHALPSGQLVDVGGPSRQSENRLRISHLHDFFREVLHQRGRLLDDFVSSFFSDSEDSELSELYDYYDI